MKLRIKSFIAGMLVMALILAGGLTALAKVGTELWNVNFMNIKLVVDGILIEPKDSLGNAVEPFAYNGTTYLPVRAVAEAFKKEVSWDGDTSTVYLGDETPKAAKEVLLYNRSYIECSNPNEYKAYDDRGTSYLRFYVNCKNVLSGGRSSGAESVVYPLNALAKTFKGTFMPPNDSRSPEAVYKIYNESGKLLYQSPIMTPSTSPVDFEVDITHYLSLKIEMTCANSGNNYGAAMNELKIKNPVIITSDYID